MTKVLITPIAAAGQSAIEPFEVTGKLTQKYFNDCGLIYYIGGWSYPARIVTILEGEVE